MLPLRFAQALAHCYGPRCATVRRAIVLSPRTTLEDPHPWLRHTISSAIMLAVLALSPIQADAIVNPGARGQLPLQGLSAPSAVAHFIIPAARHSVDRALVEATARSEAAVRSPLRREVGAAAFDALTALHRRLDAGRCDAYSQAQWQALDRMELSGARWEAALLWSKGWLARCRGDWPTVTQAWTQVVELDAGWCDVVAIGFGEPARLHRACPHLANAGEGRLTTGAVAAARRGYDAADPNTPPDGGCSAASNIDALLSSDASARAATWRQCRQRCDEAIAPGCREEWTQAQIAGRELLARRSAGARQRVEQLLRDTLDHELTLTLHTALLRDARRRDQDADAWRHVEALVHAGELDSTTLDACLSLGTLLGHQDEVDSCWWEWYLSDDTRRGGERRAPLDSLMRTIVLRHLSGDFDQAATMLMALESKLEASLQGADRARIIYWSARVAWDQGRTQRSRALLQEAWQTAPLSYFGQSARRLHETLIGPIANYPGRWGAYEGSPQRAISDPSLLGIMRLHEAGFERSALVMLRDLVGSRAYTNRQGALLLAIWTAETGNYRTASWMARDRGRIEDLSYDELMNWGEPLIAATYPLLRTSTWMHAANEQRVNPAWMPATIRRESGFRDGLISGAGARGLMQIVPETASWLDRFYPSNPLAWGLDDPLINSRIGARLLRHLASRYDESPEWVSAAYSAGSGRVDRWRERWPGIDGAQVVELVPYPAVRDYITDVVSAFGVYSQRLDSIEQCNAESPPLPSSVMVAQLP